MKSENARRIVMLLENTFSFEDPDIIAAVAYELRRPGFELAFVRHREAVYYTRFPQNAKAPSSAVIKLLQNIFEIKMDLSFFILRNKIYTTSEFSYQDHGMVKVLAKKVHFGLQAVHLPEANDVLHHFHFVSVAADEEIICSSRFRSELIPRDPSMIYGEEQIENELVKLTLSQARGSVLHDYDRPIAAVLVNPQGQPEWWCVNSSSKNKSLHAEVNLIQGVYESQKGKIPQGFSIYVTHKPCKMCAGMIFDACEDSAKIQLRYLNNVTGCRSRWTVLDVFASKNLLNT